MVLQIIFKKTDTENDKSQAFWMKSPTHLQCLHNYYKEEDDFPLLYWKTKFTT